MEAIALIDPAAETDLDLLHRFREEGDHEAFAEIVRRYASAVFSTCFRVLGDKARADDVSQETFFRLSQRPDAVKQSLGGWLHTAATRLAIDAVRSESSRAQREANYEPKPPSQSMQWADISPHVDEALAQLPDEIRVLLVRHFLQNVSQCMLAGELRTSPATVSRKIKAGVELLRKQLAKKGVCLSAALLVVLFREHAAHAAPVALLHELGKITMLSGGKPATAATATAAAATGPTAFAGSFWWVTAIASLAVIFGVLYVGALPGKLPPPAPQRSVMDEPRADAEQFREGRLQIFRQAGLSG